MADPSLGLECEDNNCPICMMEMAPFLQGETEEIARLPCAHVFHDGCIAEWIKTASSCPYCRREFDRIDVLHDVAGAAQRSYPVVSRLQEEHFSDVEEDEEDSAYEDTYAAEMQTLHSISCIICGSREREDILMICDSCADCYHSFCLGEEGLRRTAFFCPTCSLGGIPEDALTGAREVRTVANLQGTRRRRAERRRPRPRQQLQLATWTEAWSRVRERAWARLNEEVEYEPIPAEELTEAQEEELRHWRSRVDRRGAASYRPSPVESRAVDQDPATASLWRAFEQASKFSKAGSKATASSRGSKSASPKSPPATDTPAVEEAGPSRPKQKRPNASARKSQSTNLKRPASPTTDTPVKRTSVSRGGTAEGGFLSSLLSNIKQARPEVSPQPVRLVSGRACRARRPVSPVSMSGSASSSTSSSPVLSPAESSPDLPPVDTVGPFDLSRPPPPPPVPVPVSPPLDVPVVTKAHIARLVSARLRPYYKREISKADFIRINQTVTRRIFADYEDDRAAAAAAHDPDALHRRVRAEVDEALHRQ